MVISLSKDYMRNNELEKKKELILELLKSDLYVPMKIKELSMFMQVPKSEKFVFHDLIDEMIREGSIEMSSKGKLTAGKPAIVGTYEAHNGGFGFVIVEGREKDFYISEFDSKGAMNGDTVEIRPIAGGRSMRREEAEVVKIVKRGTEFIVGTFVRTPKNKGFGFVIPDNDRFRKDVFVPIERSKGAEDGDKVVVKFSSYGDEKHKPEGIVTEIIGKIGDPHVDIESIVKSYGIPEEFKEHVLNQAERVAKPVSDADMNGRRDLRDMMMVTIDGEDAKDLDDAVSLSQDEKGWHLGVHIADVTNYVQENSALDREAKDRGTSVYLADRVIPMLPRVLSNGMCSLNQHEDRLAMSCLMTINENGQIIESEIVESVINVDRRMSYNEVQSFFDDTASAELKEECAALIPMFEEMHKLSKVLRAKRHKRGGIDFDFPETKVVLDEDGHAIDISLRERNDAHMLIEDFMLAANETVAESCFYQELPFVYRTHEAPDPEKIESLRQFVINMGYHFKVSNEEVHPKEVQKLLGQIEGSPEEALISRLTLRSMKQAKYTTEPIGHFGLACQYYCHFTSPIRRYPDLQIHRIIKDQLRGRMNDSRYSHYENILAEVAKHSSEMERRADEVERKVDKLKMTEYMIEHIGEEFDAVISGVTSWGIYAELSNGVEGMIRLADLSGDYYVYDENSYAAVGEHTGKKFGLGQKIRVLVEDCDVDLSTIDLLLAEEERNEDGTEE